jgi:hypothetical protein
MEVVNAFGQENPALPCTTDDSDCSVYIPVSNYLPKLLACRKIGDMISEKIRTYKTQADVLQEIKTCRQCTPNQSMVQTPEVLDKRVGSLVLNLLVGIDAFRGFSFATKINPHLTHVTYTLLEYGLCSQSVAFRHAGAMLAGKDDTLNLSKLERFFYDIREMKISFQGKIIGIVVHLMGDLAMLFAYAQLTITPVGGPACMMCHGTRKCETTCCAPRRDRSKHLFQGCIGLIHSYSEAPSLMYRMDGLTLIVALIPKVP